MMSQVASEIHGLDFVVLIVPILSSVSAGRLSLPKHYFAHWKETLRERYLLVLSWLRFLDCVAAEVCCLSFYISALS